MLPHLTITDALILMLYLGMALAIGSYALMRKKMTTDVYFFAARSSGWLKLGASLFSSQFLLAAFFPLNGSFHAVALGVMASAVLMLVGMSTVRILAPREVRGALIGWTSPGSAVPVVILCAVRLAATMLFCSYALEFFTGWNPGSYTIVIILVVGLFTIIGGYRAVASMQAFLMTGALSAVITLAVLGDGIRLDAGPWPLASLFGLIVLVVWSWLGDHYHMQPLTSARSAADVSKGLVFTAVLNCLCIAALLFTRAGAGIQADAEFPAGVQGVIIAGILSMVMSSLGGLFSSTAAFFTLNIVQPRLSNPSQRTLVLVGRLVTTAIVIAAIVAVTAVRALGAQESSILQTALAVTAAPLAAAYGWNMFSRTHRWPDAGWPVVPALALGMVRLLIDTAATQGVAIEGWPHWFMSIHFLSLSFFLFTATLVVFAARTLPAFFVRFRTGNE